MRFHRVSTPPPGPGSGRLWKHTVGTLVGFLVFFALAGPLFERVDLRWMDLTLQLRSRLGLAQPLADEILIVDMDNRDLNAFGTGGEYAAAADTIRKLGALGVRAIILDVLYSRGSDQQQLLIRDAIDDVLQTTDTRIILPAVIYPEGEQTIIQKSLPLADGDSLDFGIINMRIDPDRIWRRYSLAHTFEDTSYPSLALAAFEAMFPPGSHLEQGAEPGILQWTELADDFVTLTTHLADTKPRLLNFRHSYYSDEIDQKAGRGRRIWNLRDFDDLHQNAGIMAGSPFQGAIVFFGYGSGLDEKATCMGSQEPGVFLHAVALSDLIQQSFLRRTRPWQDFLELTLLGGLAIGLFSLARKKRQLFTGLIVGVAAIFGTSIWFIWGLQIVPGVLAPAALWTLLVVVEIGHRHTTELFQRIRLDTTIRYYFSPRVLKHVRDNPGSTEPREAELTLLLTDIRNFTKLCEAMPARDMFQLLSHVFEIETAEAMAEDGSLQHFWGDQFLAYWGAPEPQPDAADRALRAVEAIARRLDRFGAGLPDNARSLSGYGIGLHRGAGLVGNMGAGAYLDYTVFGDAVNTAARLEALTKTYGTRILASRQFCDALSDPPRMRVIDEVVVAGKSGHPLEVIELRFDSGADSFDALNAEYEKVMSVYRKGEFDEAERRFVKLNHQFDDPVSKAMAMRCRRLRQSPPADWDGVYRFNRKEDD